MTLTTTPAERRFQTLIEHWDGASWAIVTSPNTSPAPANILVAVTCASASDCWAVGYDYDSVDQTLIERWDGTSWAIVSSPNASAGQRPLWRDVRVGVRVLGRRRLRCQRQRLADPDRALGRDLVGHRQLAQHQRYAVSTTSWA